MQLANEEKPSLTMPHLHKRFLTSFMKLYEELTSTKENYKIYSCTLEFSLFKFNQ
jgi:hypothetical protein